MEVEWIHFKEIASTHEYAKAHAGEFDPKKCSCFTAESQTAGRGRYQNRSWVSKKGNLHLTFFLSTTPKPYLAQLLAFSAAELIGNGVMMKWPNDLIFEGKKFSGTIAEVTDHGIVLSIGMNVNESVEADQPTTTLKAITGKEWDLNTLSKSIVAQFLQNLRRGFPSKRVEDLLAYRGEKIRCDQVEGILLGINEEGFLRLKTEDGEIKIIHSGEINRG
ncbi:MAG: biotin--[acetyl-CoA-carboxylase] ligase [Simkaniaceae bacterium]|nr:biotin--[acetyl-CoA-carboxylase] ligase [Candidatus Sacchlamyda saccharinae]